MIEAVRRQYRAYAGFVTTPQFFDDSPTQFVNVSSLGVGIIQRVNHIDGYEYTLDERARNFGVLEESAVCLGRSHCQVVGQVGTNWVHCTGTSPTDIERICADISAKAGAPFVMAGQAIVDGLREIGAETITVANGYFRPDWSAGINAYLEAAGFRVLWAGNIIDQGLIADHDEMLRHEAATLWDYPDDMMFAGRGRCPRPGPAGRRHRADRGRHADGEGARHGREPHGQAAGGLRRGAVLADAEASGAAGRPRLRPPPGNARMTGSRPLAEIAADPCIA